MKKYRWIVLGFGILLGLLWIADSDRATCSNSFATSECLLSHPLPTWTFKAGGAGPSFDTLIHDVERKICDDYDFTQRFFVFWNSIRGCAHCAEEIVEMIERIVLTKPSCFANVLKRLKREDHKDLILFLEDVEKNPQARDLVRGMLNDWGTQ